MSPKEKNETSLKKDYKKFVREHGGRVKYEFSSYVGELSKIDEMKYRAVYKCRLCGKEFVSSCYWIDNMTIDDIDTYKIEKEEGKSPNVIFHFCKEGEIGFADLIGGRKVNEND